MSDYSDKQRSDKRPSDKRLGRRTEADYIVQYSLAGRDSSGVGYAIDHSESGIRFQSDRPLVLGRYLTMRVPLQCESVRVLTCLANVVRCLSLPDGNGYAVGCVYD